VNDLRVTFVLRALEVGSNISALCREYGISRKTGYKWLSRYREDGLVGLRDRSRRPKSSRIQIDFETSESVLQLREETGWGPKKIHERLKRYTIVQTVPSERTIARLLKRKGKIKPNKRGRPRKHLPTGPLVKAHAPNDLWTVDFKGWWRTLDGRRCEPLTIRDAYSRYIFCARPLGKSDACHVRVVFEQMFKKHGLPKAIRCDNGPPFASLAAPQGLTALNAWWRLLGIKLDRIAPGHPEQNGAHERMHLDVANEIQCSPGAHRKEESQRLERWRQIYNVERPHEALGMQTPMEFYTKSPRRYTGQEPPEKYPSNYLRRKVNSKGFIRMAEKECFISEALRGRIIGLQKTEMDTFTVWFCNLSLGYIKAGSGKPIKPLPVEPGK